MRKTTEVWVELANPGSPNDKQRFNGELQTVLPGIVKWLLSVTVLQGLRITIATSEEKLDIAVQRKTKGLASQDIMAELEEILAANSDKEQL